MKATAQEEIRPEPVGVVGPLTTLGERFVEAADGVRLFVQTFGVATENPAVVCIPGLTRTGRDFTGLATELAQDRLVLAVDLRGRGRSDYDPTKRSYRLEIYAHDVGRILDDFGVEKASLIGTSLGGLTAIWLGAAHPDRVAAIVLNDIGPEIQPEGAARIAAYAGRLAPVRSWDDAVVQTRLVSEDAAPGLSDDDWLAVARQRYREEPDGTVVLDHDPASSADPRRRTTRGSSSNSSPASPSSCCGGRRVTFSLRPPCGPWRCAGPTSSPSRSRIAATPPPLTSRRRVARFASSSRRVGRPRDAAGVLRARSSPEILVGPRGVSASGGG